MLPIKKIKDSIKDIKIYPEIGGKVNQLGSLDEIIEEFEMIYIHQKRILNQKIKDESENALIKIEGEIKNQKTCLQNAKICRG